MKDRITSIEKQIRALWIMLIIMDILFLITLIK